MKLDQLSYFVEAAKLESVGKASRAVGISPSAMSSSIASLERELGHRFFSRERKRIFLTQRGRILMERASRILDDVRKLQADLGSPSLPFEGHYKIAATRSLAAGFAGKLWANFQATYPKLTVEFQTLRSIEIVSKTAAAEIDLGLCFDPPAHPDVECEQLSVDRYQVAVRQGHPLTSLSPKEVLQQLANYPACMPKAFNGLSGFQPHSALEKTGIRPRVDLVFDSYEVVFPRLLGSDSWALLPSFVLEPKRRGIRFLEIEKWDAPISIVAVWPKTRHLSPALSQFISEIEKYLRRPIKSQDKG